ncbi:carbamoyl phosphate synthase small subunit [Candidatus Omnitrophus magneticus]|uniref:Carbamoyl phosphate synthase small chain n=1 Tax=Candidatus Omnitrophus magneticus TaxID=1609969 RepID=A0A0F0CRU2_9BACT|nr:carbamoyl phosphate synthase small subunit [Candidatus Omnitrophus magneticus]
MNNSKLKSKIALEDGRVFEGFSFGASGERYGEVVFNTSISGYQEILTDPSYRGQIVVMTYPLIGNYGVNKEDIESRKIWLEGFIAREYTAIPSNWRSEKTLSTYLKENGILGLEDVDTRAITRNLRIQGAMRAVISTEDLDNESLVQKAKNSPSLVGRDLVKEVTCSAPYKFNNIGKFKVAVIDCGVKLNILRNLSAKNCELTVFPATSSAKEILAGNPNGVFLSNGPGDPEAVPYVFKTVSEILGKIPVFGICLGHQMLALALGGKTYKLKFGHHGANHPVKDLIRGDVSITSQNHGFAVDTDSIKSKGVEITHINLNDNTVEGMESKKYKFFSVQYHPEAAPGPRDAAYLFDKFIENMKSN